MLSGDSLDGLVGKDVSVKVAESMHEVYVCLQVLGGAPNVSYAEQASVVAPDEFAKLVADIEENGDRLGFSCTHDGLVQLEGFVASRSLPKADKTKAERLIDKARTWTRIGACAEVDKMVIAFKPMVETVHGGTAD